MFLLHVTPRLSGLELVMIGAHLSITLQINMLSSVNRPDATNTLTPEARRSPVRRQAVDNRTEGHRSLVGRREPLSEH